MIPGLPDDRRRIALAVEYDGSGFLGWQRLSHGPSVQATVERALSFVANEAIATYCSGRTDAGVHAQAQVVHFDTTVDRSPRGWLLGGNTRLPRNVVLTWAGPVPSDFHARFSARRRRYRYLILNRAVRPALLVDQLTWQRRPLAVEPMQLSAQALLGEHDFSAFRARSCQASTARRRVHEISIQRSGDRIAIEIEANAFLQHMVRNIVGSLLAVGRGDRPPDWLAGLLAGGRRELAAATAPAQGLTFIGPRYPRGFGLPDWLECEDLS